MTLLFVYIYLLGKLLMTVCGSLFAMLDMFDPFLSTCLMKQLDDVLFEKKKKSESGIQRSVLAMATNANVYRIADEILVTFENQI